MLEKKNVFSAAASYIRSSVLHRFDISLQLICIVALESPVKHSKATASQLAAHSDSAGRHKVLQGKEKRISVKLVSRLKQKVFSNPLLDFSLLDWLDWTEWAKSRWQSTRCSFPPETGSDSYDGASGWRIVGHLWFFCWTRLWMTGPDALTAASVHCEFFALHLSSFVKNK